MKCRVTYSAPKLKPFSACRNETSPKHGQQFIIYNTHVAITVLHIGIEYYILHEVQVAYNVVQISRIFEQHAHYLAKTHAIYISVMKLSQKCRSFKMSDR